MIDAVKTSGTTPILPVRNNVQRASVPEAPSRVDVAESLNSTRIRVDNFLDLAIIEVRSNETGDVIRQYPTEMQIEAFQRATQLQQRSSDTTQEQPQSVKTETFTQNTTQNVNNSTNTESISMPSSPNSVETSTQSIIV